VLVDHGIVNIPAGATRWEGRFLAASTATGDDVHLDHFFLVPIDEGYGQVTASGAYAAPTSFVAYDDFASGTYASGLPSDTLPTGGTWTAPASAYTGTTNDFTVAGGVAARAATGDTATNILYARWLYASGTSAMTNVSAEVSFVPDTYSQAQGVVVRATDRDNFVAAIAVRRGAVTWGGRLWSAGDVGIVKVLAGSVSTVFAENVGYANMPVGGSCTIRLQLTDGGAWVLTYASPTYGAQYQGTDTSLGSGTLASGYAGILDWMQGSGGSRSYDNFYVYAPITDAAVCASQSVRITHNAAEREDSGGAFWTPVSRYEGDYLTVPASGRESRTTQVIVKACRSNPYEGADGSIDNISAQLHVRPRFLQLPS
jgi:hypothetical protein